MTRRFRELPTGKTVITDIICDRCGQSTRTLDGFEKATLAASFEEGFHAGDRFIVELCQQCFDSIMAHILVDRMGTCMYHSEIMGGTMEMEDLREMYAHIQSGTVVFDEDDFDEEDFGEDYDNEEL